MSKRVTLIYHRDEIEYDAQSILSILADTLQADEGKHIKHVYNDICESDNEYRTMRYINRAYQECVQALSAYTDVSVSDESSLDNTAGAPASYEMYLLVDDDFSKGQVALLKDLIHDYIVYAVVRGWLMMIDTERASVYDTEMSATFARIKQVLDNQQKIGRVTPYFAQF